MVTPAIPNVRGVRQVIPSGSVLGRVSSGSGAAEVISMKQLADQLNRATAAAGGGTGTINQAYLGFSIPGIMGPNSIWKGAIANKDILFPSNYVQQYAQCDTPPTEGTFTIYFVTNLASYQGSGYPNGVAATLQFANGVHGCTFTWLTANVVTALTQTYLVWPNDFDVTLAGVEVLLAGDLQ